MAEDIMKKFGLPSYLKGKSFSDASKTLKKRFEGRTDKESMETQKELMGRLRDAQDFVKSSMEQPEQETHTMPDGTEMAGATHPEGYAYGDEMDNKYFLGGMFGGNSKGGSGSGNNMQTTNNIGGGLNSAFGNNNAAQTDILNEEEAATADTWENTKDAVSNMGPWFKLFRGVEKGGKAAGQAIGGDAGGDFATGFLDPMSNKTRDDYSMGEKIAGIDPLASAMLAMRKNKERRAKAAKESTFSTINQMDNRFTTGGPLTNDNIDFLYNLKKQLKTSPFQSSTGDYQSTRGVDMPKQKTLAEKSGLKIEGTGIQGPSITKINTGTNESKSSKVDLKRVSEALRYAPVVANAMQLASLKKPKYEALDRLGNRYERQLTDEEALQNLVREQASGAREAIVGSSGGSGSVARANLLASQLQSTKALSDAYLRSTDADRGENRMAQQFNLGVDQTNLQQSNMENQINAQNLGNFQTQKSKLIAALGDDLGGIGREELFKRYPELMGLMYNNRGKYIGNN